MSLLRLFQILEALCQLQCTVEVTNALDLQHKILIRLKFKLLVTLHGPNMRTSPFTKSECAAQPRQNRPQATHPGSLSQCRARQGEESYSATEELSGICIISEVSSEGAHTAEEWGMTETKNLRTSSMRSPMLRRCRVGSGGPGGW